MRVEREDEFWMLFEDLMLVFSNLFVLLDTRSVSVQQLPDSRQMDERASDATYHRFAFSHAWTERTSGGTPIPIKQPVHGTAQSWARNPQFALEVRDKAGAASGDGEVQVVCLLQQHDPRSLAEEYGGRFPFQDALHEIFMCISEGAVGSEVTTLSKLSTFLQSCSIDFNLQKTVFSLVFRFNLK